MQRLSPRFFSWSLVAFLLMAALPASAGRLGFRDTAVRVDGLERSFSNYRIVTVDDEDFTKSGDNMGLTLAYRGTHAFTLRDSRLLADNYLLRMQTTAGIRTLTPAEMDFDGRYYISTEVNAVRACALSTYAGQYYLYFRDSIATAYIEPLSAYVPGADPMLYIAYTPADLKPVAADCGGALMPPGTPGELHGGPEASGCFVTELAIVCDYSLFQKYGSVNGVLHRTINITNLTKTDYKITNGLTDNVDFKIVEHYVPTCDTCNPWTYTTNIFQNLYNITDSASSLLINTYDLAQYWFNNPSFVSGTVGLAYLGATCDADYRYNTILDFSTSLASMRTLNSHEIGHNFDCNHDAAGSPTIMAPSVNGSSTWSPASVSAMGNFLGSVYASCLSACPATVALCDTLGVNNIAFRKDSIARTITVKWTGMAGVDYNVRLYRFATASWTPYMTVAAGVDSAVFAVPPGVCAAKWKAEIIPVCPANLLGGSKMTVFNYRGAPGLWTGITSSAWFTTSNWCGLAIPLVTTDVFVPGGVPFAPVLNSSTAIGSLMLQGGSMTVQPGAVLSVD